MKEKRFDAREMEHPEPLEGILAMLPDLKTDEFILMIHRREPFPLYEILEKRGFQKEVNQISESHFEIRISHNQTGGTR